MSTILANSAADRERALGAVKEMHGALYSRPRCRRGKVRLFDVRTDATVPRVHCAFSTADDRAENAASASEKGATSMQGCNAVSGRILSASQKMRGARMLGSGPVPIYSTPETAVSLLLLTSPDLNEDEVESTSGLDVSFTPRTAYFPSDPLFASIVPPSPEALSTFSHCPVFQSCARMVLSFAIRSLGSTLRGCCRSRLWITGRRKEVEVRKAERIANGGSRLRRRIQEGLESGYVALWRKNRMRFPKHVCSKVHVAKRVVPVTTLRVWDNVGSVYAANSSASHTPGTEFVEYGCTSFALK
ncbi:hypothetical protein OE88DRAFT_1649313 [Heliocybe sulcata]|uniref:Uncharacterized protein n=1 Tax=Heliocybe sulcata TaxID=5364 RepID=A0A5C3ML51_9AGAM|nr:hypothetical protein OE88DRAFT_1649313 [Heliocybe sulcata]